MCVFVCVRACVCMNVCVCVLTERQGVRNCRRADGTDVI